MHAIYDTEFPLPRTEGGCWRILEAWPPGKVAFRLWRPWKNKIPNYYWHLTSWHDRNNTQINPYKKMPKTSVESVLHPIIKCFILFQQFCYSTVAVLMRQSTKWVILRNVLHHSGFQTEHIVYTHTHIKFHKILYLSVPTSKNLGIFNFHSRWNYFPKTS
jgi:hypothetical protein